MSTPDTLTSAGARPFNGLLEPQDFGGVLMDSFSRKEMVRLISSLGIVYPGSRMEMIPHLVMAMNLAEDACKDASLMSALEKELDKVHRRRLDEARETTAEALREQALSSCRDFLERDAVGEFVWCLARDPRPEVSNLLKPFLKSVERFERRKQKKIEKVEDFIGRLEDGNLTPEDAGEIKRLFGIFTVGIDEKEKLLAQAGRKIEALSRDELSSKKRLSDLSQKNGQLASRVGELKRELEQKICETERLKNSAARPESPKAAVARHRIKELERELGKNGHALAQVRQALAKTEERLEKEASLRKTLSAELDAARLEILSLKETANRARQESAAEAPPKPKSTQPIKEKGRRLGVFVDAQYLWLCAKELNRKVDFQKLLDFVVLARHLVKAAVYVEDIPVPGQRDFCEMLKRRGYEVRSRGAGMAADISRLAGTLHLDIVHFVGMEGSLAEGLASLKSEGARVELSGFPAHTNESLLSRADDYFVLDETVLL